MTQATEKPIVIAGGGIGGLTAALGLAQKGFDVTVLERAPVLGEIGAGIQLAPNAFQRLRPLGRGRRCSLNGGLRRQAAPDGRDDR
jgi:2-polyprenyl-6-methoxyphenol hydroxylase-like FAD-dependent oxidoreductase